MSTIGASISGLQASQQWLDVISNNVSNSQTVAFKEGRLSFSDLISEGLTSASGPNNTANLGGINPSQIGLGVSVGSVQTIMNQGALTTTGNVTDIAINGTGFLTVSKGSQTLYTRAGNLTFDQQGNLVTADGGQVQGWQDTITRTAAGGVITTISAPTLDTTNTSAIGNIQIPNNLVLAPAATTFSDSEGDKTDGVQLKGNLDSNTPVNPAAGQTYPGTADATSTFTVYDSLGNAHIMEASFFKVSPPTTGPSTWNYSINEITGNVAPNAGAYNGVLPLTTNNQISTGQLTFNADGSLDTDSQVAVAAAPPATPASTANGTLRQDMPMVNGAVTPFIWSINVGTTAAQDPNGIGLRDGLTSDYGNGTTNALGVYTPVQTAYSAFSNGYPEGTLNSLSFNQTGGIDALFSNGQNVEVAKVALTKFDNQDGLTQVGSNYFETTANSGTGQIGTAGSNGFGTVQGGALEASNVDLTVELTNMILAQNMYQANARVITTEDHILQTLTQLGQ
jgi:flagellar hook protein FlgE